MLSITKNKTPSIADYKLSYKFCEAISVRPILSNGSGPVSGSKPRESLFGKMQIVVQPLAGIDTRHIQAGGTVGQRCVEDEAPDGGTQDDQSGKPACDEGLAAHAFLGRDEAAQAADRPGLGLARGIIDGGKGNAGVKRLQVENEFNQRTTDQGGRQVRGQVVVQETLAAHQPEGEVVGSPAQEQKPGAVVQTRAGTRAPD